jgi:hypothetical protein
MHLFFSECSKGKITQLNMHRIAAAFQGLQNCNGAAEAAAEQINSMHYNKGRFHLFAQMRNELPLSYDGAEEQGRQRFALVYSS